MRGLTKECVYAIALEILRSRLLAGEGRGLTLASIRGSDIVRKFCGRSVSIGTVHYVEKALKELPELRLMVRLSKELTLAEGVRLVGLGDAVLLAIAMWEDAFLLNTRDKVLKRSLSTLRKAVLGIDETVNDLLNETWRKYFDLLNGVLGQGTIYAYGSKKECYGLKISINKLYTDEEILMKLEGIAGYGRVVAGIRLLSEVYQRFLEIEALKNEKSRDFISYLRYVLEPIAAESLRRDGDELSDIIAAIFSGLTALRIAAYISNTIHAFIRTKVRHGEGRVPKPRRWKTLMVREGFEELLSELGASGRYAKSYLRLLGEWFNGSLIRGLGEPIRIERVRVTEKELNKCPYFAKVAIRLNIAYPPPVL